MTTKGYRVVSADVSAPRLLSDRLTLVGRGRYRYFPQEDYFGIGPQSRGGGPRELPPGGDASSAAIAALRGDAVAHVERQAARGWIRASAREPTSATRPSAPCSPTRPRRDSHGSPRSSKQGRSLEIDSRDQPGNPRSGTYISLLGARYRDFDDFGYDFSRVAGEVQHYVPIFDKKRVIRRARRRSTATNPTTGHRALLLHTARSAGKTRSAASPTSASAI